VKGESLFQVISALERLHVALLDDFETQLLMFHLS